MRGGMRMSGGSWMQIEALCMRQCNYEYVVRRVGMDIY